MSRAFISTAYETKEERKQRIQAVFESFDKDGNGTIEEDEFLAGMQTYFHITGDDNVESYNKFFKIIFKWIIILEIVIFV